MPKTETLRWSAITLLKDTFRPSNKDILKPKRISFPAMYNTKCAPFDTKLTQSYGLYRNKTKSKKWYNRIFFYLIDIVIVNAWILWCKYKNADVHLVDFKLVIANLLANAGKDPSAVTRRG